jgi:protein-S-isoprenylcysteine O-methyltransferase Ste14
MTFNVLYVIYQLHYYIPIYSPIDFSPFIFNWYYYTLFIFLYVYIGSKRILYEEKLLKQNFDKEWDLYFKKRKRLIPYLF